MSEWKAIETAPRHYKPIWGCDAVRGYDAKILHNGSEWECVSHDNFPLGVGFYPTHWQYLPIPPQRVNVHSQREAANGQATAQNECVTVVGSESGTVSDIAPPKPSSEPTP